MQNTVTTWVSVSSCLVTRDIERRAHYDTNQQQKIEGIKTRHNFLNLSSKLCSKNFGQFRQKMQPFLLLEVDCEKPLLYTICLKQGDEQPIYFPLQKGRTEYTLTQSRVEIAIRKEKTLETFVFDSNSNWKESKIFKDQNLSLIASVERKDPTKQSSIGFVLQIIFALIFIFTLPYFQRTPLWPLGKATSVELMQTLSLEFGLSFSHFLNLTNQHISTHRGTAPLSIHFIVSSGYEKETVSSKWFNN